MASDERDANHIWLRQSVQFTQDGRERTIEIALPLPVGAAPHEVERLLAEADAGMARLARHLDQQVAAALGGGAITPAAPAPADTPPPAPTRTPTTPAASQPGPVPTSRPATPPARIAEPASAPVSAASPPARPMPAPAATSSAQAPLSPQGAGFPTGGGVGGGGPLTRPEFLAETRALGLTPPQVMERIGVRSLDGLNLREALEMLRRQLGNSAGSAAAAPEPAMPRAANGAAPARAVPPAPPVFDEEEEFELVVLGPDMAPEDYGEELPYGDVPEPADALDALDDDDGEDGAALDDVPDLGAALPPPAPEPGRSAGGGFTPAQKTRARELVASFRAVAPGGSPARSQHTAFANVVADQLTAATAETLARGLWGQPPERLGTDQLDAVIRWGKQDEFAEEAPVVLALLRAEQAHKAGASAPPAEPNGEAEAPPRPSRAARKPAGGGGRS